jgi:hypothetical protein
MTVLNLAEELELNRNIGLIGEYLLKPKDSIKNGQGVKKKLACSTTENSRMSLKIS